MRYCLRVSSAAALAAIVGLAAGLAWIPARADEAAVRAAAVAAATDVANHWIESLDGGNYTASWSGVAAVMKEGREQSDWVQDVAGPRASLGKAVMRDLQHAEFETSVRGAPEGAYVTCTYLSQFPKTPLSVETVLLRFEGDQWRIAGYNIAPAATTSPASAPPGKSEDGAGAKPGG